MTEKIRPVPFNWNGEAMIPHPRFRKLCDQQFVVGLDYVLVTDEQASTASRRHYFAALHDVWLNLPEEEAARFPNSEFLRKWCLVKAGYADERTDICDSAADARRLALTARALDGFAIISCSGNVVKIWTAKSQSPRAMDKAQFQESKQKVLDIAASMIGTTRGALQKNAGRAA